MRNCEEHLVGGSAQTGVVVENVVIRRVVVIKMVVVLKVKVNTEFHGEPQKQ